MYTVNISVQSENICQCLCNECATSLCQQFNLKLARFARQHEAVLPGAAPAASRAERGKEKMFTLRNGKGQRPRCKCQQCCPARSASAFKVLLRSSTFRGRPVTSVVKDRGINIYSWPSISRVNHSPKKRKEKKKKFQSPLKTQSCGGLRPPCSGPFDQPGSKGHFI